MEGELAVRLGEDLCGSFASDDACRAAIAEVFPAIELHHYVLPAAWPRDAWLIASEGLHAGFVFPRTETRAAGGARSLVVRIIGSVVGTDVHERGVIDEVNRLGTRSGSTVMKRTRRRAPPAGSAPVSVR